MKKIVLLLGCFFISTLTQADSSEQDIQLDQGLNLLQAKQYDQAEHVFKLLVEKFPGEIVYLNNLAVAQMALGKTDEALQNLTTALDTDKVYSVSQKNLSQVYAFMASQAYSKALDKKDEIKLPQLTAINESPEQEQQVTSSEEQDTTNPETDKITEKTVTLPETASELQKDNPEDNSDATPESVSQKRMEQSNSEPFIAEKNTEVDTAQLADQDAGAKESVRLSAENTPDESGETALQIEMQLKENLAAWANSWMRGEVEAYLSYYSPSFLPPDKLAYNDWLAQRRYRLKYSKQVQVSYNHVEIYLDSHFKTAIVEFEQHYSAGNYSDVVKKQLYWQLKDNTWLITREQVTEKI